MSTEVGPVTTKLIDVNEVEELGRLEELACDWAYVS